MASVKQQYIAHGSEVTNLPFFSSREGVLICQSKQMEQLGYLTSTIAHDFNNLLTTIMGNASLALMKLPLEHASRHYIEQILKTTEFATALTSQLLAYSQQKEPERQLVDLNKLVQTTIDLLDVIFLQDIDVELCLTNALPLIEAIPTQIQQIVMNLTINAAEAIREPDGRITFSTGLYVSGNGRSLPLIDNATLPGGEYLYFSIQDTGQGMDAETLAHIFDPFFSTKSFGYGLGLAALQDIVQRHNGAIVVKSKPDSGTTFTVLLPTTSQQAI
jgi:two-component system, cell cycle sensor histidine kinase and response regulator CckA